MDLEEKYIKQNLPELSDKTKRIFTLYEAPAKPIVLPSDFKSRLKASSKINIKEYEPTIGLSDPLKLKYRYFYRPYK